MAIALDLFTVIVRIDALENLGGLEAFIEWVPNSTFCHDEQLARCSFMDSSDALEFIDGLFLRGLETKSLEAPDVTLANGMTGQVKPACDWLQVAQYKARWIAWRTGEEVTSISAPRGWNPEQPPEFEQMSHEDAAQRLQFLRRDENVEVFLDRDTGREVFVGRTNLPLEAMFEEAREVVFQHLRQPGGPPAAADAHPKLRRCIEMLQIFTERRPDTWSAHWLLGKAWHALDDLHQAHARLSQAIALERDNQAVTRELAGICLELGKPEEAVVAAELAVAQAPDDGELLGNLALAYLLAGRHDQAQTTIEHAIAQAPDDPINRNIRQVIDSVVAGKIPQPRKLADLA
ncbi:MAG: tetratricopeptide repeat protein [Planctomycetales bacterium]|nr:tetratricopeptide repeat protein [Planctomycetales bacterium]